MQAKEESPSAEAALPAERRALAGGAPKAAHLAVSFLPAKYFVVCLAFVHGLHEMQSLAVTMFAKGALGLSPDTVQFTMGLVTFHWCVKPLFGYLLDRLMRRARKAKYVVAATSLAKLAAFRLMAECQLPAPAFFACVFAASLAYMLENIIAEYLLVVATKRLNRERGGQHNQLPFYFGFRAAGSLVGAFLGGRLILRFGAQFPFRVCSLLPLVVLLLCVLYREKPYEAGEHKSFAAELADMKALLCRDKVFGMMGFVMLINLQPCFDNLNTYYFTDVLRFSTEQLANFAAVGTVCYIAGLVAYAQFFCRVPPKPFYVATNAVLWLVNVSFLLVVLGLNERLGVNNQFFCLFSQGFYSFVAEINFMPILTIWCALCPDALEATAITLFTGLINLSGNLSAQLGGLLTFLFRFHEDNYRTIWLSVVIANAYLLVVLLLLLAVPFPEPAPRPAPPSLAHC